MFKGFRNQMNWWTATSSRKLRNW